MNNKSTHIMVDLETMSTEPNAAPLSIGAVVIQSGSSDIVIRGVDDGQTFYGKILPNSSESLGLHVSKETMQWWDIQDSAVRAEAFSGTTRLESILWAFMDWCQQIDRLDNICIWGNGADFDPVVLKSAYETHTTYPFDFRNHRCYRTVNALFNHVIPYPKHPERAHNALEDARHQAKRLGHLVSHGYVELR